jgi:hypothetical protein
MADPAAVQLGYYDGSQPVRALRGEPWESRVGGLPVSLIGLHTACVVFPAHLVTHPLTHVVAFKPFLFSPCAELVQFVVLLVFCFAFLCAQPARVRDMQQALVLGSADLCTDRP